MKVAVSSSGKSLDSMLDPRMGRCQYFMLVNSETMDFEVIENGAANASGGAGIQAAQTLLNTKVDAVVTGNVGPNAWEILEAAGIKVYRSGTTTIEDVLKDFQAGRLQTIQEAGPAHGGLRMRHGQP